MKKVVSRRKVHIAITLAVMVFIFVHSAMPGEVSGNESRYFAELLASLTGMSFEIASFIVRKAAHFTEFTVLGICLALNFYDLRSKNQMTSDPGTGSTFTFLRSPVIAAWITGTLYAATDEFHQLFVAGRSCEFRDMCIDAAGVALGALIIGTGGRFFRTRSGTEEPSLCTTSDPKR